jgi:hypothetical protein
MSVHTPSLRRVPQGLTIDIEGGKAPVQIQGRVDGTPFYFRARGMFWTVSIGEAYLTQPSWFWGQRYSHNRFDAGFMSLNEARGFLFEAISRYRAGGPDNEEAYLAEREIDNALKFEPSFEVLEKSEKLKGFVEKYRAVLKRARAEGRIPDGVQPV